MKRIVLLNFFALLICNCFSSDKTSSSQTLNQHFPKKMILIVPVTDLRKEPIAVTPNLTYPIFYKDNSLQDSQLLMGECVLALNKKKCTLGGKSWLKVYALEQNTMNNSHWTYKEGWIESKHAKQVSEFPSYNLVIKKQWINVFESPSDTSKTFTYLSIGTKLTGQRIQNSKWYKVFLPNGITGYIEKSGAYYIKSEMAENENSFRKKIVKRAVSFLESPYSWGGRSGYNNVINDTISYSPLGVDCSGFINLIHRSVGLEIPRDAHDQFEKSNKIKTYGNVLKPGDLIFFALTNNPTKIIHVGMFDTDIYFKTIIHESSGEWANTNCRVPGEVKFGKQIENIKYGETCGKYVIYFGSFLNDQKLVKELRETALKNDFTEFKNISTELSNTKNTFDKITTTTQK